ncbi:aminopeptidase [Alicyclobacillus dauci]|uniref:Aminopeptidase n=1 Tax=Alicyclobacillus dauci TaxID=1475485 RepID=A0ABY6YXF7_9BACL|nr:aminopeptidase [Alicyclobacillus dauci]WAH35206.1 aminopeptidase [Alicyclobacillus dauci]
MANFKLYEVAQRILRESVKLEAGETVCIVSDTNTQEIGEVFASCVTAMGSEPTLLVINPSKTHGVEPPKTVAAAMKVADVVLQPITYAITHTDATKAALEAGARVLVMRGVTTDVMINGAVGADYQEIDRVSELVRQKMTEGRQVRVISPSGTDITLSIAGRAALTLTGIVKGPGTFAAMPDGESAIAPVEGTANGTIVVDHTMDGIGLVDSPIYLKVEQGRVTSIEGGRSAERLRTLINEADEGATNIAEFAIGTNPKARLVGNMAEDKKKEGSVHIAIGDSHVIGGTVVSSVHLDGLLLSPTVWIDNECVIDEGRLLVK